MSVVLRVPPVEDPDFVADLEYRGGAVLSLVGSADQTATRELRTLLDTFDAELREKQIRSCVIDMRELELMAAACVNVLVAWLAELGERTTDDRYRIVLRGNPTIAWQRHTLPALSCFDTELVTVEM